MSNRNPPFTAWRLMPSFKPATTEIVEKSYHFGEVFFIDANGRCFKPRELYGSKEEAIQGGERRLDETRAHIAKLQAGIDKKAKALQMARNN